MASDLISKQAAIDAIVNTVSHIGLHDNSEVARYGATFRQHEIIDIIENLPSAQPTIAPVKHGRWELAEDGWYCSACELYPPFDCDPEEKGIPYCPYCGARME